MGSQPVADEQGNWVTVRYDSYQYLFSRVATGLVQHWATYESGGAMSPLQSADTTVPAEVIAALNDCGYECVSAETPAVTHIP